MSKKRNNAQHALKILGLIILSIVVFVFSMSFSASTALEINDTKILIETITMFFGFFGICVAQLLIFNGGRIDRLKEKREKCENIDQIKKELKHATERSRVLKRYILLAIVFFSISLFCAIFLYSTQSINADYLIEYKNSIIDYGSNILIKDPSILMFLIPSLSSIMLLFTGLLTMIKLIQYTIQEQCDSFKDDL